MAKLDKRTKGALWLLIGPSALIIVDLILYALMNWIFTATAPAPSSELFAPQTGASVFVNILLFIFGLIGILAWLPGIIIGIVLLTTKPIKK